MHTATDKALLENTQVWAFNSTSKVWVESEVSWGSSRDDQTHRRAPNKHAETYSPLNVRTCVYSSVCMCNAEKQPRTSTEGLWDMRFAEPWPHPTPLSPKMSPDCNSRLADRSGRPVHTGQADVQREEATTDELVFEKVNGVYSGDIWLKMLCNVNITL